MCLSSYLHVSSTDFTIGLFAPPFFFVNSLSDLVCKSDPINPTKCSQICQISEFTNNCFIWLYFDEYYTNISFSQLQYGNA